MALRLFRDEGDVLPAAHFAFNCLYSLPIPLVLLNPAVSVRLTKVSRFS